MCNLFQNVFIFYFYNHKTKCWGPTWFEKEISGLIALLPPIPLLIILVTYLFLTTLCFVLCCSLLRSGHLIAYYYCNTYELFEWRSESLPILRVPNPYNIYVTRIFLVIMFAFHEKKNTGWAQFFRWPALNIP